MIRKSRWGIVILWLVMFVHPVYSQQYQLTLNVVNVSGQPIDGASIRVGDRTLPADVNGHATIRLDKGNYLLTITAIGYQPHIAPIAITSHQQLNISLTPDVGMLRDIVITGNRAAVRNQMSIHTLSIAQIKKLPVILGEVDPLKTLTLLPGIKSSGEAGAGIYVRGGGPDQNLVLLDGIQVYNPNHLLGFFSVFNGDAVKDMEVIKGGMPAEYGGRLSSVIAINTREGSKDSFKVAGGIGLISSRLSLEGPIVKGKSSFSISARRTYIDQVARLIAPDTIGNNGYFFYDINAKAGYDINENNTLDVTFYNGRDKFTFVGDEEEEDQSRQFDATWGNTILGLGWKQKINKTLKQELLLVRSSFNLNTSISYGPYGFLFSSGLTDYQVKNDWTYTPAGPLKLKAGAQYIFHRFRPGAGSSNSGAQEFVSSINDQFAREAAAYISADIDLGARLNIIAGLRWSYFNQVGPTERVLYGADGIPTGEVETIKSGESIARYHYPEPRLNVLYRLNNDASLKFAYTRTAQYLHLATTSAATFPSDVWVPAGPRIKPGLADQVALGFFQPLQQGKYALSIEAYYKTMNHLIEFRPGAQLLLNQNIEGEMTFGSGKAYGIEVLLQKKAGRLNGWIGYTLSRAERTFPDMNNGKPFIFRYDRPHDLSLVGNYRLSKKWEASLVFVYGTGNALTLPAGRFFYNVGVNINQQALVLTSIDQYGKINDYRMPAYHRLDIGFIYTPKPNSTKRYKSSWAFSLYNVYNRRNPFFIYMDVERGTRRVQGKQVSLFPILPGITWNFKI